MTSSGQVKIESDVDIYIKESCKSYKECSIKNTVRRNSLMKKTMGIESERRQASAKLSREERQLRDQLKQMNIEKAKNHIIHHLREPKPKSSGKETKMGDHVIPTEPYPITFKTNTLPPVNIGKELEWNGVRHGSLRERRQSKEFEDLSIDIDSGTLSQISEMNDYVIRPRVQSMSCISKNRFRTVSVSESPTSSPHMHRKVLALKIEKSIKGCHSNSSSRESLSDNAERLTSLEELRWVGEPAAINSVRRLRKTVEEQEHDAEVQKLSAS